MDYDFFFAYVKDWGSNLNAMTTTLKSNVKCEVIGLNQNFQGACFAHVFLKTYYYATTNEKVCKSLRFLCKNQVYQVKFVKIYNLA
jgi:hypothetical protein